MPIAVHLLGPPLLVRDGVVYAAPRGRKVWALLAYLALSDGRPAGSSSIDLLFPDAEDPAGALRWNLSELRRLLGGPDTVGSGNVVQLRLPERIRHRRPRADGGYVGRGRRAPRPRTGAARGHGHRRQPGLRGMAARASDGACRARRGGPPGGSAAGARLRERADGGRARHPPGGGRSARTRTRTSCWSGRSRPPATRWRSQRQLSASVDLFRRELGVEPGPELAEARERSNRAAGSRRSGGGRAGMQALVESGEAAVSAGAIEAGVEGLREGRRRRCASSRRHRDSRRRRSSRSGPRWCTRRRGRTRRARPRSTGASPRPRRRANERSRPRRIASSATSSSFAATTCGRGRWLRTRRGAGRRRPARAGEDPRRQRERALARRRARTTRAAEACERSIALVGVGRAGEAAGVVD